MTGVALRADFSGLKRMAAAISRFESVDRRRLLDGMGASGVSQTQRRIQEEKTSPDGKPWPAWSPKYAKSRHSNQSLLIGTGVLVSGITHNVLSDTEVEWGSPEIYAATQNYGDKDRGIPQREFQGVSDANADELEKGCADFMERTAGELQ